MLIADLTAAELGGDGDAGAEAPDAYDLDAELESGERAPLRRVPPSTRHLTGLSAEQIQTRAAEARNREQLLREKVEGNWFAALVSQDGPEPWSIGTRFANWNELVNFVQRNQALVEVWADPGGGSRSEARRITPREMAAFRREGAGQPTSVTLTFRDAATGQVRSDKLEFAFDASARALTALQEAKGSGAQRANVQPAAQPLLAALQLEGTGAGLTEPVRSPRLEQALQEGGVVEQVLAAESGPALPAIALEPRVHAGPQAVEEKYTAVLGDLLEWRRYLQKKALGLPMTTAELLQAASALEDLASKSIWIDDADALLAVDAFHNSFVYRRYVNGQPQLVRVAGIPSRSDRVRELTQAEAGRRLELRRRAALSPQGKGMALVHRVQEIDGRPEVGALVLSEDSAEEIDSLLALVDRLPVAERARVRFDGLSRTLIDFDFEGTGARDRFFLTLEFPPGQSAPRDRINPLTGERERLVEENGLLIKTITDARIVEIDYNAEREEAATRTYANTGSRQAPAQGSLLEETRTVETWGRDLLQGNVDPYLPTIAKSRFNHVTGETTREIYGLFPLPVAVVDEQFIVYRQFNPYGIFTFATVFDNGAAEQDFVRPPLAKLNEPVIGRERFQISSTLPPKELEKLRSLQPHGYLTTVLRRDLVKSSSKTQTFDNRRGGRKASEACTDRLDKTNTLPVSVTLEYRDDFYAGQIPVKSIQRHAASGKVLLQTQTQSYDPLLRRLVGVEVDYTGKTITNVWDWRWAGPVETLSPGRKTVQEYNRDETRVTGFTSITGSGEEISRFKAHFDPASQLWRMQRVMWFQPGITNQNQTVTLSAAGRVLLMRTADTFERRPVYGPDGAEIAAYIYRKNPGSSSFNLLQQHEDNYQWNAGQRNARIQLYVDGQAYDSFRRVSDVEGRIVQDELRQAPGLTLQTVIAYDGWSERPLKAETLQNGQVRQTRQYEQIEAQPDRSFLLPVKVAPYWGLAFTERFRVGDPLARAVSCRFENDHSLHVTQWYDGTAISKTFELRDRHGRPREKFTRRLNAGMEGPIACDLLECEKLSFWGAGALVEKKALFRGTDLPVYRQGAAERTQYDISKPFDAPAYAVDPQAKSGRQIFVKGQQKDHVLTVFNSHLYLPDATSNPRAAEPLLWVESVDLRPGTGKRAVRRTFDRAGNLLDERMAVLPDSMGEADKDETLFAALAQATAAERLHYRYQPGWLVEQPDTGGLGRSLTFSSKRPDLGKSSWPVNEGANRDWMTQIEGIKPVPPAVSSPAAALKNYFFRRIHSPSQKESNPFLPGCSNVWTAWIATELAPDGEKLFDAELIYDAQGHLSASRITQSTGRGPPRITVAYQLPEPNPDSWKPFRLANGTASASLDLGGVTSLKDCEFVYFYLQNTNGAPWNVRFKGASGQEVRVTPTAAVQAKGEVSTAPVASFGARGWPDRTALQSGAVVAGPRSAVGQDSVILISVPDLARAGLDLGQITSATIGIEGKAGEVVKLSSVQRLMNRSISP